MNWRCTQIENILRTNLKYLLGSESPKIILFTMTSIVCIKTIAKLTLLDIIALKICININENLPPT